MNHQTSWELLSYYDPIQRQKWHAICNLFNKIDIFYYPNYVRLFELHGEGEPYLFVYYQSSKDIGIYPFFKRTLKNLPGVEKVGEDVYDIASPYGYSGYLRNSDKVNMEQFYDCFQEYCKGNNIISEFIRFHPILGNVSYAPKKISVRKYNQTIMIELNKSEEDLFKSMSPSCKNKIRKAIKKNVKICYDKYFKQLHFFYKYYIETMKRLEAIDYYFFKYSWFEQMIQILRGQVYLFHAYFDNKIIASALFIEKAPFLHYFLTGALFEKRQLAATNLLLYEVALWAKKRGYKYFHLGGGCFPDDSLFRFKASFSSCRKDFYIGSMIHHQEHYDYMCRMRFDGEKPKDNMNYFPLYRIPEKLKVCKNIHNIF